MDQVPRPGWNTRPAEIRDALRISEIYNEGIEDGEATFESKPRTQADIEENLRAAHTHLIIAEWGNKGGPGGAVPTILGWASITPYSSRECYAGIGEASVYISRSARHQGLGRLLMAALVEGATGHGYHKLVGRILVTNQASRQLVRALGFREVGIHQKHGKRGDRWMDVVIVERLLTENL